MVEGRSGNLATAAVFGGAESPSLVKRAFRRHVSEGEKNVRTEFAKPQCITMPSRH